MDPQGSLCAISAPAGVLALASAAVHVDMEGGALLHGNPETSHASAANLDLYLAHQFLPWCREGGQVLIATADTSAENIAWIGAAYDRPRIVAIAASDLHKEIARRFRDRLSEDAVFSLSSKTPKLSASRIVTRKQGAVLIAVGTAFAIAGWVSPFAIAQILVAAMSVGFVLSTAFRAALALLGGYRRGGGKEDSAGPSDESSLPPYTILVPLYREAKVLPQLARALLALDYPRDKLDIKLVVEEDDSETCAVAEALTAQGPFEVIFVPPGLPRTKPKACNYALRFARGDYLVIYDAEDRPEPDQLRKAADCFRKSSRETACLQARLEIYNADDSWLARIFAIDYAIWFKVLLPGLSRLRVPMPLGGTSNHFRTSVLRAVCGWDPFNVTEDADLGIRLARLGYRVAMLDSTTFEEAPAQLGAWLRQRSRWLKGYMQTWLVHARDPVALTGRVGLRGVAVIQLFIGGAIWSALVNPMLWLIFASSFAYSQSGAGSPFTNVVAWISGLGLFTANAMLAGLVMADTGRLNRSALVPYGLGIAFYWGLISIAAYRGLWQLVFKPFYWEKTPHGQGRTGSVLGV